MSAESTALLETGSKPARSRGRGSALGRKPARTAPAAPVEVSSNGELALLSGDGEVVHTPPGKVTESLRYMLARARVGESGGIPAVLGITASVSGEGVTYISRSLALVFAADAGERVCLVDLNWGSPSTWTEVDAPGMAQIIDGSASVADALITTGTPGVSFLPAGGASRADRHLLANHPALGRVLHEVSVMFDRVIVDLPAVNATSEALSLADKCGAVGFVVGQGVVPDSDIQEAIDALGGVEVLGVILNRSASKVPAIIRRRLPSA